MSGVDPQDDTIERWVVRLYRFDPARNERRLVVVAAFDNESEFLERIRVEDHALRHRKAIGEADDQEHVSGVRQPPGYRAAAAEGRATRRRTQAAHRTRPTA